MASVSHAIYPSLRGKNVLITGGAEGIGAADVELFCRQGSNVAFFDISESSAIALIERISDLKPSHPDFPITRPKFYHCDVTNIEQLQIQADKASDDLGGIDVLVNNAASAGAATRTPTDKVTPELWQFGVDVALRHMFFLTQRIVAGMRERKRGGAIVNMGSITWRIPAVGLPVYTTCKSAVVGLTRTHAHEFGPDGIRVNSIMPGAIATERQIKEIITPEFHEECMKAQAIKRTLRPHEVAALVVFLSSDEASAISGSNYVVDGGYVGDS